jgi:arylformamidase
VYELDVRNQIDVSNLRRVDLTASPRILFKTCKVDDRTGDAALRACAGLTPDAADALVRAGVRLVGLDSASADPPSARGFPAHRRLLEAGVIILEDLDLSLVPPGAYELLCLPLKIRGGDGAPARVVLRALD